MKEGTKELFEKLYNENNFDELNKHVIKRTKNVLIAFGIFIVAVAVYFPLFFIGLPILIIYVSKISSKEMIEKEKNIEKEIAKMYKEKVIIPVLKYNLDNLQYMPEEAITLDEYKKAEYIDNNIDKVNQYSSNDHMILPLIINGQEKGNMDIYDVRVNRIYSDNDGQHTERIFEGLTLRINLPKNINTKIKLEFKYNLFGNETFDSNDLRLDMTEFERYFDVHCEDKILATRIFTSEIMEKLLSLFKTKQHLFDINILEDKLFVRVHGYAFFEPFVVMNRTNYQRFEQDFLGFEEIEELTKLIYNLLENMEI